MNCPTIRSMVPLSWPRAPSLGSLRATIRQSHPGSTYAGDRTEAILPSLISGVPDDRIRSSSNGQHLYLHVPASPTTASHWQLFDPQQTVFARPVHRLPPPWFARYNPSAAFYQAAFKLRLGGQGQ